MRRSLSREILEAGGDWDGKVECGLGWWGISVGQIFGEWRRGNHYELGGSGEEIARLKYFGECGESAGGRAGGRGVGGGRRAPESMAEKGSGDFFGINHCRVRISEFSVSRVKDGFRGSFGRLVGVGR